MRTYPLDSTRRQLDFMGMSAPGAGFDKTPETPNRNGRLITYIWPAREKRAAAALLRRLIRVLVLWRGRRDLQKLDIEDKRLARRNDGRLAPCPVGKIGRNNQFPLVAFAHDFQRLRPARNNAVDHELRRERGLCLIEHLSVDQATLVEHFDGIDRMRRLAETVLDDAVLQAAWTDMTAGLLGIGRQKSLVRLRA